jgi:hypothetical protein
LKHPEADLNPFYVHADIGKEEIPMETVSIYLVMPIGLNRSENSRHGQEALSPILEDSHHIARLKPHITQKMHALKMFLFR